MTVISWSAGGSAAPARSNLWPGGTTVFLLAFLVYLAGAGWVQAHGYVNDGALRLWADVLMSWQSPDFAEDRLSIIYPQLRYYLALAFYGLTRSGSAAGLGVFAALAGAAVALIWFNHLRAAGWRGAGVLVVLALVAFNPLTLWAVTRGGGEVLALLGFTWLALALRALREHPGFRAEVSLAASLAVFFFLPPLIYLSPLACCGSGLFARRALWYVRPRLLRHLAVRVAAAVGLLLTFPWVLSAMAGLARCSGGAAIYGGGSRATRLLAEAVAAAVSSKRCL